MADDNETTQERRIDSRIDIESQQTERRSRNLLLVGSIAAISLSAVTLFFTPSPADFNEKLAQQVANQQAQISAFANHIETITTNLNNIINGAIGQSNVLAVSSLSADIKALNERFTAIEKIIQDSPEKAIALTVMDQKLAALTAATQTADQRLRDDIATAAATNFNFLAILLGTLAIATTVVGVANYVDRWRDKRAALNAASEDRT